MINIPGIQIIGVVLACLIFYEAWTLYKKGKFKPRDFGIWSFLAVMLAVFSILPGWFSTFLNLFTNLGRGIDALMLIGILGAYALIFQVYIRVQETNRRVTDLVREVAIELEQHKKR